jgi:hypothetical protein
MTGVAKRTSPRAGFFGSSTGGTFRGLSVGLGVGVAIELVFRGAGAIAVLFAAVEGTTAGAGEELAAAKETSGCETGLETEGVDSAAGEAAG